MKVVATTRKEQGSSASRRLRRSNQVPGIIYGGSTEPRAIEVDHNNLFHALRVEAYGTVDEASSAIGVARVQPGLPLRLDERLASIQNDLFDVAPSSFHATAPATNL